MPVNRTRYASPPASTNFSVVLDAFENDKITDSGRRAQVGFAGVARFRPSVVPFECHRTGAHPLDAPTAAIPASWTHLFPLLQLQPLPLPQCTPRTRGRTLTPARSRWTSMVSGDHMMSLAWPSDRDSGLGCSRVCLNCVCSKFDRTSPDTQRKVLRPASAVRMLREEAERDEGNEVQIRPRTDVPDMP